MIPAEINAKGVKVRPYLILSIINQTLAIILSTLFHEFLNSKE